MQLLHRFIRTSVMIRDSIAKSAASKTRHASTAARVTHAVSENGDLRVDHDLASPVLETSVLPHSTTRTIILNRPKALHALNKTMFAALTARFLRFQQTGQVQCIIIRSQGTPGRAFCAGGDVKTIYNYGDDSKANEFDELFRTEYTMNSLLGQSSAKPTVSIWDGIVMGGGVGLSIHGKYRIATENTVFAMPECAIGLHPDIGASYFLPRLPSGVGYYMGLTGARLKGEDVVHVGLATHFVPSHSIESLIDRLECAQFDQETTIETILNEFAVAVQPKALPGESVIRQCFTRPSVEEILSSLDEVIRDGSKDDASIAGESLEAMKAGCPMSLKLAFESLTRGQKQSLDECLVMDFRLTARCIRRKDFYSGVRSALITKDRNPSWEPSDLSLVTVADVTQFFAPLDSDLHIAELQLSAVHAQPDQSKL